jgi:hypothetical protein
MDRKKDDSFKLYNKFFMKSAIFDIIGGMINKVVKDAEIRGKIKI